MEEILELAMTLFDICLGKSRERRIRQLTSFLDLQRAVFVKYPELRKLSLATIGTTIWFISFLGFCYIVKTIKDG